MEHPGFFDRAGPYPLAEVAAATGAELAEGADPSAMIDDVRPLSEAGRSTVAFVDNIKYLPQLATTAAGACLVVAGARGSRSGHNGGTRHQAALSRLRPRSDAVLSRPRLQPMAADARSASDRPDGPSRRRRHRSSRAPSSDARPRSARGTRIAAGAVIGARVTIGRNCYIGALATITHALVGDRVIIHSGVRIGQDGFGFAMGPGGHLKVPQIGRVIIQDDVEIGANTTIDRGALKDTIIGEGTKIDNLVQIGHNVVVGRHCVIVSMCGISGSTELGDYVVMGGQSGTVGHIKIGNGAQVGGASHPTHDVPPGARYFGTPAKTLREAGTRAGLDQAARGARQGQAMTKNKGRTRAD